MDILELELFTACLDEQKEFYINKLGFQAEETTEASFTVITGSSRLKFVYNEKAKENYYHFAFNIPQNQLDEAIVWAKQSTSLLEHNGSPVINFPNWNAHSVYFYDPQGNIVELIARHNLPNNSNKTFSAESVINISEVGLPVESPAAFYNRLHAELDINLWWGNLETFAAAGSEDGLFIIVTTERNWFPTGKPSNIFPLKIKIRSGKTKALETGSYTILSSS